MPFLDVDFLNRAMNMQPQIKMPLGTRMEKHILRQTFADYLPHAILWRQKEQFSDGVGYGWIDALQEHAASKISDQQFAARARKTFPTRHRAPKKNTSIARFLRSLLLNIPSTVCHTRRALPARPPAAMEWDKRFAANADPSGRAMRELLS